MPDAYSKMPVKQLSRKELDLRAYLVRLASRYGFVRATLNVRERTCGKDNCKCARGEKHSSLYLVMRRDGKLRQLFVPKEQEGQAREWVARYQQVQGLIDDISDFYWDRLERREN
jgi:hypothetical protein